MVDEDNVTTACEDEEAFSAAESDLEKRADEGALREEVSVGGEPCVERSDWKQTVREDTSQRSIWTDHIAKEPTQLLHQAYARLLVQMQTRPRRLNLAVPSPDDPLTHHNSRILTCRVIFIVQYERELRLHT